MLHMYSCISVSRYESLLRAVEPTPLYALRLLLSMTEHSAQICRYRTHRHETLLRHGNTTA